MQSLSSHRRAVRPKIFHTKKVCLTDNQWEIMRQLVKERGWSGFEAALDEAEIVAITSTYCGRK